ncbi:NACHT, LRR and PYD domains-containing protein 10 [Holothuria leucospilota]|uniref:NACHT, LRR and PYD domains-containing protein 10 n=1 Tax=Holothuria leucospilota TaxID=206669 RepID=A0A9Q1CTK8_HOLLE|nr:NACHT, LRR and PYD domains-containing protein 10 [Holothuria leucospilota]
MLLSDKDTVPSSVRSNMERSKSHRGKTSNGGFGRFLVEVASLLTLANVRNLTTLLQYRPAEIDAIERDTNPSSKFLMSLIEKGIIGETNISKLLDSLRSIDLHGVAEDVKASFTRNISDSLSRPVITLNEKGQGLTSKKNQFLKEIKETYEDIYNGVLPIPYLRERLMCVDNVFIDSGLEYFKEHKGNKGKGTWQKLNSYNSILIDPRFLHAMVFLIKGEPGYGKSILALQYVYDWCKRSVLSPLKDVEMLLFLRLRYLKGFESIFCAIKHLLLPCDTKLSENDISDVIRSCKSVVIIFDGFDEYSDSENSNSDVLKIIERRTLRECKVILTTRHSSTSLKLTSKTVRVRLNGFANEARERYVLKAVVEGSFCASAQILQLLQRNPALADICQVPLFFVMFAHMTHEKNMTVVLNSVTSFFRYVVSCFYEHIDIKTGASFCASAMARSETEHYQLSKIAFESLRAKKHNLIWEKDKLVELIGELMYKKLVEIGILVEQNVLRIVDDPGTSAADHIQRRTDVSFYHKLFCEWYAAHYVARSVADLEGGYLHTFLEDMDPSDLQYVYRIACGLNPVAAEKIIQYLQSIEGGDKFAVLCILEQTGEVDKIKEPIRDMCFEGVIISGHDSLLLQRSSMQLLEIAARSQIPIEYVCILNCLQSVDLSSQAVRTTSGLALSSRIPVKWLSIALFNREMTDDEAIAILQFAALCPSLCILTFYGCVPPRVLEGRSFLSSLKSRDVTVRWWLHTSEPIYILNLSSGTWKHNKDGSEPTAADFERALSKRAELILTGTEEHYREEVKKSRETRRKQAEEKRRELDKVCNDN